MLFIPGWLFTALTFPGVIVHEAAHRFFCDLTGVPVYAACYFRFGNPAGYVVHGPVDSLGKSLLIAVGPLLLNSLLCIAITFPAVFPLHVLDVENADPVFFVLQWVGISIGAHAFPSNVDINNFIQQLEKACGDKVLLSLSKGVAAVFKLANALRVFWFDLIYALMISKVLPVVFIKALL